MSFLAIQLAYFACVYRKRQVPFRAPEITPSGLATTDDEQLDSITRYHIINELRRTTGSTSKSNGINGILIAVWVFYSWCENIIYVHLNAEEFPLGNFKRIKFLRNKCMMV